MAGHGVVPERGGVRGVRGMWNFRGCPSTWSSLPASTALAVMHHDSVDVCLRWCDRGFAKAPTGE